MKTNLKRKNYDLDQNKIRRVRTILGVKTETEAIDAALNLVVFRKEILKSLEKVAGKGGVGKVFSGQAPSAPTVVFIGRDGLNHRSNK